MNISFFKDGITYTLLSTFINYETKMEGPDEKSRKKKLKKVKTFFSTS